MCAMILCLVLLATTAKGERLGEDSLGNEVGNLAAFSFNDKDLVADSTETAGYPADCDASKYFMSTPYHQKLISNTENFADMVKKCKAQYMDAGKFGGWVQRYSSGQGWCARFTQAPTQAEWNKAQKSNCKGYPGKSGHCGAVCGTSFNKAKSACVLSGKVTSSSCNSRWGNNYFGIALSTYKKSRGLFKTGTPILAGGVQYYVDTITHHGNCNKDVGLVYVANKASCADGQAFRHTKACGYGGKITKTLNQGDKWCLQKAGTPIKKKPPVMDGSRRPPPRAHRLARHLAIRRALRELLRRRRMHRYRYFSHYLRHRAALVELNEEGDSSTA